MPVTEGYRIDQLFATPAASMDDSKEASIAYIDKREPRWVTQLKE
jgi:hypothetical protein